MQKIVTQDPTQPVALPLQQIDILRGNCEREDLLSDGSVEPPPSGRSPEIGGVDLLAASCWTFTPSLGSPPDAGGDAAAARKNGGPALGASVHAVAEAEAAAGKRPSRTLTSELRNKRARTQLGNQSEANNSQISIPVMHLIVRSRMPGLLEDEDDILEVPYRGEICSIRCDKQGKVIMCAKCVDDDVREYQQQAIH